MVRASACHAEGRGSEPRHSRHQKNPAAEPVFLWQRSARPEPRPCRVALKSKKDPVNLFCLCGAELLASEQLSA